MNLPTEIIEDQVHSALDLIVQQDRLSGGKRRVTQIAMRNDFIEPKTKKARRFFAPIVSWNRRTNEYEWASLPNWIEELPHLGIAQDSEVSEWVQSVQSSCSAA